MKTMIAKMDTIYYDETAADEREECEVRFDNENIVVSYCDPEGPVIYTGTDHGHGHFVLECPERHAKATLHQIENSRFLEGYWIEDGARGFWRIMLP